MRRRSLIVFSALLLVSGSAGGARGGSSDSKASPATLLAAIRPAGSPHVAELARIDPRTLKVRAGRRVPLGKNVGAWSFSRDRRRLAIGVDRALGLRLVDVRTMRALGDVQTPNGDVLALAWLRPRRVVGLDRVGVFVVDPVAKRLVRSRRVSGMFLAAGSTATSLVLLFGPAGTGVPVTTRWEWGSAVGPARLDVVSGDGVVRTVRLDAIRSGTDITGDGTIRDSALPGFAVDRQGQRAFVIGGDGVVAEIDLRTMKVAYHEPRERASLLDRVLGWLQPSATAKGPLPGTTRTAAWLGNGLLAVAGDDVHVAVHPFKIDVDTVPYGLRLIDTRGWTMRALEPRATSLTYGAGVLLAYAASYDQQFRPGGGIGLSAYTPNGARRFHVFGDAPLFWAQIAGTRAYAAPEGSIVAVDLSSGKVVRQLRGPLPQIIN